MAVDHHVNNSEAMNKLLILAGCVAGVAASAVSGALVTDPESRYYRTLVKPSWQPPPPVYGIVWTPLYADIALSSGHAISELGSRAERPSGNGWSPRLGQPRAEHRPGPGCSSGCTAMVGRRPNAPYSRRPGDLVRQVAAADRRAGFALSPYPAWCAFATALTVAVAG